MAQGGGSGRNYYEIYLLLLTVGFAATWGLTNVGEVTSLFPAWARWLWFGGLAFSAAVAVIGEIIHNSVSIIIERSGLVFLTGLVMAYTLAFVIVGIQTSTPGHVAYVGAALVLFAAVNYARARQIRLALKSTYKVYQQLPDAEI